MMIDNITVLREDKMKINKLVINKIKNEKARVFFIKNPIECWVIRLSVPVFLLTQLGA